MLINQEELQTLCLKQSAIEELAAQVINQLNGIVDPILRYATANALKQVFEEACANTGQAAEAFCEKADIGTKGKHFNYEGLCFNRQFQFDYNYAGNDYKKLDNGEEESLGYHEAMQDLRDAERQLETVQLLVKGRKAVVESKKREIEYYHPNMVPEVVRINFRFIGDAEQTAVDETAKALALLDY